MYQWQRGDMNPAQLGGSLALLKVQTTKMTEFCAREASQIIGGNRYDGEREWQVRGRGLPTSKII